MALSRKHYQAVADLLNAVYVGGHPVEQGIVLRIASALADYFKSDNYAFSRTRFLEAVTKGEKGGH